MLSKDDYIDFLSQKMYELECELMEKENYIEWLEDLKDIEKEEDLL